MFVCVCLSVRACMRCACKRHYFIEREKSDTVPTLRIV